MWSIWFKSLFWETFHISTNRTHTNWTRWCSRVYSETEATKYPKPEILPPGEKEIIDIIKNLKERKSANDIPIAFIKCAIDSKEFVTEIVNLYQTVWETNTIPKSWGHSKLVAIWKGASKGKSSDATSYRGLQIGSNLCKIMAILIINRLKSWYDNQLSDQQQGFRTGHGTTDGIFITKRVH